MSQENVKRLPYGNCPKCSYPCQPPDGVDEDGLEFCFCCDCEIQWYIDHNNASRTVLNFERLYPVVDIVSFDDSFIPYGCDK